MAVFADDDSLVIVVADGAGGVAGGAIASDAVVDAVMARVAERPLDRSDVRTWSNVLIRADSNLASGRSGGETTAIVVVVGPHGVAGVSVGDSEAWVVGQGHDRLTEKQDRNRIGTGRSRPTPFYWRTLNGALIVGTDGLFKHARAEAITASCAPDDVDEIADALICLPKLRSGAYPDDVAIAVVRSR